MRAYPLADVEMTDLFAEVIELSQQLTERRAMDDAARYVDQLLVAALGFELVLVPKSIASAPLASGAESAAVPPSG